MSNILTLSLYICAKLRSGLVSLQDNLTLLLILEILIPSSTLQTKSECCFSWNWWHAGSEYLYGPQWTADYLYAGANNVQTKYKCNKHAYCLMYIDKTYHDKWNHITSQYTFRRILSYHQYLKDTKSIFHYKSSIGLLTFAQRSVEMVIRCQKYCKGSSNIKLSCDIIF